MKALVGGFGNIFFGDDAYGTEVVRTLLASATFADVVVRDYGIRGMHAAFEMLDGYDLVVFIDTVSRGGAPGTLYVIEPETAGGTVPDAHAMELHNALALYERIAAGLSAPKRPKVIIVGCEPQSTDEGIGISDAVRAAIPKTLPLLLDVLSRNGIGVRSYEKT